MISEKNEFKTGQNLILQEIVDFKLVEINVRYLGTDPGQHIVKHVDGTIERVNFEHKRLHRGS